MKMKIYKLCCGTFFLILTILRITETRHKTREIKKELKISFLASVSIGQGMGKFYGGAYYRAIDDIRKNSSILPNYVIETMFHDTANDYLKALHGMTDLYVNDTIGFVGPEGTCSHAAIAAASWNLPMIAYVSTYLSFNRTLTLPVHLVHAECRSSSFFFVINLLF